MEYICNKCNYKTSRNLNYLRHLESSLHKETDNKNFICDNCPKKFTTKFSLQRHKNICTNIENKDINNNSEFNKLEKNTKLIVENIILKEKLKLKDELLTEKAKQIKIENKLKEELSKTKDKHIEYLQQTNIENSRMAHSAQLSAINFASMYYNKPIGMIGVDRKEQYINKGLRKLPDMKRWIKNKPELAEQYVAEKLIVLYSNDKFIDYICNVIHNAYKTEDPIDQTIWSTDVSRLVYIVRSTIENEDKLENKWEYDKKGVKIKQSIIDPLLDEVQEIINQYLDEMNKLSKSDKKFDTFAKLEMVGIGNTIIHELKNRLSLKNQIIKAMAPLFFLERTVKQIEYIETPKNKNISVDMKLIKKKNKN